MWYNSKIICLFRTKDGYPEPRLSYPQPPRVGYLDALALGQMEHHKHSATVFDCQLGRLNSNKVNGPVAFSENTGIGTCPIYITHIVNKNENA